VSSIVIAPHPALRRVARPVEEITPEVQKALSGLLGSLRESIDPPGVGLAAPQIDQDWRIFATQLDQDQHSRTPIRLFVNPVIVDKSDKLVLGINSKQPDLEGCLSIPELYAPVLRSEWVTLQWRTPDWQDQLAGEHTETFFDFSARVIQHELDHLNGVLFTDHVREQRQPLFRSVKDSLVEVSIDEAKDL
jgi:peptide deformylase